MCSETFSIVINNKIIIWKYSGNYFLYFLLLKINETNKILLSTYLAILVIMRMKHLNAIWFYVYIITLQFIHYTTFLNTNNLEKILVCLHFIYN